LAIITSTKIALVNAKLAFKISRVVAEGIGVLTTGNQLKAARAMAGLDQAGLAERAGVNVNTVRNMESKGGGRLTSGLDVVHKVQSALEAAGVEFLNHGRPGVRLRVEA
jgi:DNA-binding XRE family transcriptional regulator